jgi:molecular chaperone IbpA
VLRDAEYGSRIKSLGETSGDFAMATTLSLAPLFRHSVGFDRFNDLFESALRSEAGTTYPPHNVEKHGDDHYRIVIAAAGLVEDDLEIQVEKGVLTVAGGKREHNEGITYLHQGIAQRAFRLSFRLVDHIEVQGAQLSNGLLSIDLLRVVPEEAKPKRIAIGGAAKADVKSISEQ